MNLFDKFFKRRYKRHPQAMVISCYFNPTKSRYRKKVFDQYYETIKHLDHRIIECIIGDGESELPQVSNLEIVRTTNVLWHKETLLNKLIFDIPETYYYVFWVDADVIFTNMNWLVDGCKELERRSVIQPFEYCVHLDKDEIQPKQSIKNLLDINFPRLEPKQASKYKVWRSFGVNQFANVNKSNDYDIHGHVGFAWGARLDFLKSINGLYDKGLVGGADHIMAHAFAGEIPCECIEKSFGDQEDLLNWSKNAYREMGFLGIGYVPGNLYHLWHGDIEKRQYLKRIQEFTSKAQNIKHRDDNGLFITDDDSYVRNYFQFREFSDVLIDTVNSDNLFSESTFEPSIDPGTFDGGQFGGSGAGADWDDNIVTENFS